MASEFSQNILPKKCGLQFKPPALVVVYEDTENLKLKKRVMPLRNLRVSSSVTSIANELKIRHQEILEQLPLTLIEKMLSILQEHMRGSSLEDALITVNHKFMIDPEENLNALSDVELRRKKELMDSTFVQNQIKPSDPSYVYDKQIDFEQEEKVESGWDEENGEEEDFWA